MRRNAHTLTELVVVVLIMGTLAMIAIPRLQCGAIKQKKLAGAAHQLVGDLRKTRSLAMRDAATNDDGYRLRLVGASPYTEYLIENADTGEEVSRTNIDPSIVVTSSPTYRFVFGRLGNMTLGGDSQINLSADGKSFTLTFVTATGAVLCTKN